MLIEEGKKALNREIVVMSDAQEDEIDDGSGAWEEDSPAHAHAPTSISRSNSAKRTRRPIISHNTFDPPFASSAPTPSSMTMPMTISPRRPHISGSEHGDTSISFPEDERTWESPELRELMERARARAKMGTGTGTSTGFYRRGG
jgi:hypothetical protein